MCIAAICSYGRRVVAASDRMITYTAPPFHQFEHPKPKMRRLARCVLF